MPQPENAGPIYWSASGQNFYQEGRVGPVPRLEAIESLRVVETARGTRLMDEAGHFVPNIPDLIPRQFQTSYLDVTRESKFTNQDTSVTPPGQDAGYTTIFTYRDLNGDMHVGVKRAAIGQTIDPEVERAKMIAQIGADLGIDPNSEEGGSENIDTLIVSMFHFITS